VLEPLELLELLVARELPLPEEKDQLLLLLLLSALLLRTTGAGTCLGNSQDGCMVLLGCRFDCLGKLPAGNICQQHHHQYCLFFPMPIC